MEPLLFYRLPTFHRQNMVWLENMTVTIRSPFGEEVDEEFYVEDFESWFTFAVTGITGTMHSRGWVHFIETTFGGPGELGRVIGNIVGKDIRDIVGVVTCNKPIGQIDSP